MKSETKLAIVLVTTIMLVVGIGITFWAYPTITTYEAVKIPAIKETMPEPLIAIAGKILLAWAGYASLILLVAVGIMGALEW